MNKMDSSRFQEMARQDRNKLIASITAIAVSAPVIFIIGLNMQNMALAKAIFIPVMLAIVAFVGFLVLRLAVKMERDSFQEGMYLVMEGAPLNCTIIDEKGAALHCNEHALKLFDVASVEEYAAKLFTEFLPEVQPDGSRSLEMAGEHIKTAYERGIDSFRWHHKKGQEMIPAEVTLVAASVYGMQRVLVFLRDLREEEKIRKQEEIVKERMQAILDSSPMFCTLLDEKGNILEVNQEAEHLFDIPDRQILVKNYYDFCPELQPDGTPTSRKADAEIAKALKTGNTRYDWMYRRRDGTPLPTEETINRITVDGKYLLISYSRDMREFYANKEKDALVQQSIQTMMEQLNANVSEQAAAVTESAAAIEEMVANIQSVTSALSKNADQVTELQSASEVGHNGINEVVTDIRGIASESESLLEINSVMANIASQTNLLSMNAAIEAAHAGEAGRGFAVVADEIRKLAESSSKQSKTISTVLKTIKASIDKITKSAENVLNRFDTIDGGIKTVAEQERGVLNAMEEQRHGSEQVLQAISQVSDITQRVKNDAQQMVKRQTSAMNT
ncbi:MAG: methyl-accepting chemotaxis protein [Treponema sp.]|nr:methyl-accepting chemotaxis protein [Treponema sp.]